MKDQDIIIEVAKLDGWMIAGTIQGQPSGWFNKNGALFDTLDCPDYLNSRDAIVPVIEKWMKTKNENGAVVDDLDKVMKFMMALYDLHTGEGDIDLQYAFGEKHGIIAYYLLIATPSQLCEALLRATGKWKD